MARKPAPLADLHPLARDPFARLHQALMEGHRVGATDVWFEPFEVYRSPEDQEAAFKRGVSKARAWQSAHQYGLAVDFVPYPWHWRPGPHWDYLKGQAERVGLICPIAWDRPHVEHPAFATMKRALRR
jgi:hypothetical protein